MEPLAMKCEGELAVGQGKLRKMNHITVKVGPYNDNNRVDVFLSADEKCVFLSLSREEAHELARRLAQ